MKQIIIAFAAIFLTLGASAQRGYHGGYHGRTYYRPVRTRTYISAGIYANPFYSPGYYYGPSYPYNSRPGRLEIEIADIKADYADKIWSARHDKSLSRAERKRTVHDLKSQRDREIRETERDYYKRRY